VPFKLFGQDQEDLVDGARSGSRDQGHPPTNRGFSTKFSHTRGSELCHANRSASYLSASLICFPPKRARVKRRYAGRASHSREPTAMLRSLE
jgi:hypothetical protein